MQPTASLHLPPFPADGDAYQTRQLEVLKPHKAVPRIRTSALIPVLLMSILFAPLVQVSWKSEWDFEKCLSGILLTQDLISECEALSLNLFPIVTC